jgi:hypothetical protein
MTARRHFASPSSKVCASPAEQQLAATDADKHPATPVTATADSDWPLGRAATRLTSDGAADGAAPWPSAGRELDDLVVAGTRFTRWWSLYVPDRPPTLSRKDGLSSRHHISEPVTDVRVPGEYRT